MTERILEQVRDKYSAAATGEVSNVVGLRAIAKAFGYKDEELERVPVEANLGLSCGNPTAFASLRPGETVVDLGSGAGLDVFLAVQRVGPTGKVIGIDMTPAMIERARAGAERLGAANIEFHLATIDRLPLDDNSVDCILSNCVINLAPDKRAVFREMFRVLKPGGRVAVSDIALKKPLPDDLARSIMAYVGCIAGAIPIDDYRRGLEEAGFAAVQVVDARRDLNAYALVKDQAACCAPAMNSDASACCAPTGGTVVHDDLTQLTQRYNVNEYAASVQVYAIKGQV